MAIASQGIKRPGGLDNDHAAKLAKFARTAFSSWRGDRANSVEMVSDDSEHSDDEMAGSGSEAEQNEPLELEVYSEGAEGLCALRHGEFFWNFWVGNNQVATSYIHCVQLNSPQRLGLAFYKDNHTMPYVKDGSAAYIRDPLAVLPISVSSPHTPEESCRNAADAVKSFLVNRDKLRPDTPIDTMLCSLYKKDVYEKMYPSSEALPHKFSSLRV
ncbi:hypothetical protein FOL47_010218 [Perkinsus chesapeaki]|uniref:Uncharacterized protein n=1 Tax=Perkinsus chesapeaki TaxID=330153 RepID=A0A7J6L2Y7_PERCH|nr:hypothetical protein FOL47_010218 [Perkinsus chesapeaki]